VVAVFGDAVAGAVGRRLPGMSETPAPLQSDKKTFLAALPADGKTVGNHALRKSLRWNADRYFAARNALADEGLVVRGPGYGGTFEVKAAHAINVQAVYEALAHRRAATRSYVLLHVPNDQATDLEQLVVDVTNVARSHGIGVVTAADPGDYQTWDERAEAVRV